MNSKKLLVVDPFNEEHLSLLRGYEIDNNLDTKISEFLMRIKSSYNNNEEYQNYQKVVNEVEEILLYIESSEVTGACYLEIERDRKICKIHFSSNAPLKSQTKLITKATAYALDELGLEEVFVLDETNNLESNLLKLGYECLGEEDGLVVFLKEQIEEEPLKRMVA